MASKIEADWIDVALTSPAIKKQMTLTEKAHEAYKAEVSKLEALKTQELRAKGELSADEEPIYSHKFGRWSVATSKADGSVIGRAAKSGQGSRRRSI